ncbi:MAG: septum formation initiator family protein [Acutalibacteraceae bacterium]|nr:septum formation initiator family protein [Acutalibacteraceae bacterium]
MAKVKKQRRSFIVVFFAIVLSACFAISLFSIVKDINDVKKEIAAVDEVKAEQEAENEALRDKINAGDKDEYVEEIARDKLGYVMPGERVYQDISVND